MKDEQNNDLKQMTVSKLQESIEMKIDAIQEHFEFEIKETQFNWFLSASRTCDFFKSASSSLSSKNILIRGTKVKPIDKETGNKNPHLQPHDSIILPMNI